MERRRVLAALRWCTRRGERREPGTPPEGSLGGRGGLEADDLEWSNALEDSGTAELANQVLAPAVPAA